MAHNCWIDLDFFFSGHVPAVFRRGGVLSASNHRANEPEPGDGKRVEGGLTWFPCSFAECCSFRAPPQASLSWMAHNCWIDLDFFFSGHVPAVFRRGGVLSASNHRANEPEPGDGKRVEGGLTCT